MNRPILVFYDIADDGRRQRLRATVRTLAFPVQQSFWMTPPTSIRAERFADGLRGLIEPKDRLLLVKPCVECLRHSASLAGEIPLSWWLGGESGAMIVGPEPTDGSRADAH